MQIAIHDLKANLSRFLALAQAGAVIEVTSHRKPVARLVGVAALGPDALGGLVASQAVAWTGGKPAFADPQPLSPTGRTVAQSVLEDRG